MSYFSDRREQNYAANKAAIATHKTLSPYADYGGGKYEPMQYEGEHLNPVERWEKIGRPSELERIEQLKQGEITAAFLKARWETNNPNGFEFEGEMLDWDGMVGMGFIDVIEAVHDEWIENMPPSLTTIYC